MLAPRSPGVAGPPPRIGAAVARFMLVSLAAMAVIVVGAFFALREVAINEAERDTSVRVESEARLVETAGLRDGILRGDPAAIRQLDDVVLGQIVSGSLVRVKLWSKGRDGPLLRRAGADRRALRARRRGGRAVRERRRRRRAQRPRPAGEPL